MFKFLPFVAKKYELVSRFSSSVRISAFKKYEEDEAYFKNIVKNARANNENANSLLNIRTDEPKESFDDGKMPILNRRKINKSYNQKKKLSVEKFEENDDEEIEKPKRFTKIEKENYQIAKNKELESGMNSIYENLVKKKQYEFKKFDPGYEVLKGKRNYEKSHEKAKSRQEYPSDRHSRSFEEGKRSSDSRRGDLRFSNGQDDQHRANYSNEESKRNSNYSQNDEIRFSGDQKRRQNNAGRDYFKNNKKDAKQSPYDKAVLERNKKEAEEKVLKEGENSENLSADPKMRSNKKVDYKHFYEYDAENKVFKDIVVSKFDATIDRVSENVPIKITEPESDSIEEQIKSMKPAYRPFAYTLAYFVNESKVLQKFIEMGVEIQHWDDDREICEFILKLNFDRDVAPYLIFLHDLGLKIENSAFVILKNPFFLKEKLDDLQTRIEYFQSKQLTRENISIILSKTPKWLTVSIGEMENSINWYKKEFNLDDTEMKSILVEQPKLCIIKTKIPFDMKFCFKEILCYSDDQIKRMIKSCPKLFTKECEKIKNNYYYLTDLMKTKDANIAECPQILYMPLVQLRSRFSFLKHLNRNQFDPTKPNFVSLRDICDKKLDDELFCKKVAKSTLEEFTNFLRTI
jgi:mTERF domain-containing protein, mitochondrial